MQQDEPALRVRAASALARGQTLDDAQLGDAFYDQSHLIREIKRAYHQLRETHEALKRTQQQLLHSEKMASLGRLVAGVAHELNNPISFVLGNVHALTRYTERLRQYLDELHAGRPVAELAPLRRRLRIDHLLADLPSLMEGTLEGAQRTADIVQGLKRFSAMDRGEVQVARDGIADAIGVDDHRWRVTYVVEHPVEGGRVVVEIEPAGFA